MSSYGYCERADSSFWAEPLNAWSNGAFLLAALAGLILLWRAGRTDWPVAILTALVFAIAIGSFLFHTMPQRWTLLADVVPIQLFAFFYFGLALRRFFGASAAGAILGTLFFLAASSALAALLALWLPPVLRGSTGYAGFVIALVGVAAGLALRGQAGTTACQRISIDITKMGLSHFEADSAGIGNIVARHIQCLGAGIESAQALLECHGALLENLLYFVELDAAVTAEVKNEPVAASGHSRNRAKLQGSGINLAGATDGFNREFVDTVRQLLTRVVLAIPGKGEIASFARAEVLRLNDQLPD